MIFLHSRRCLLPVAERAAIFHRYRDLVLKNLDSLMDMAQAETGKARAYAQEEVLDVAMTARHYAKTGPRLLAASKVKGMLPLATDAPGVRRVLAAVEEAKKKDLAIGIGLQRRHEREPR